MKEYKNIYIDLTGLCDRRWTGVENFSFSFSKILSKYFHNLSITNIVLDGYNGRLNIQGAQFKSLGKNRGRLITEYILLPLFILVHKPEYILFPVFPPSNISWIFKYRETKIITVIHDVVPWNYKKTMSKLGQLILIPRYKEAMKKSYMILTDSETEREALNKLDCNAIIKCVYNPISNDVIKENDTSILTKLSLENKKYIFSVSTLEPRKNFNYMLNVIDEFLENKEDLKLVLSGRSGWENSDTINNISRLKSRIIYTGYLTNKELSALYKNALFYISLPIHEGFGRTPLESLLNGTPVIVSDIPVFHELLQSGVVFLPLNNKSVALEIMNNTIDRISSLKIDSLYYRKFTEENYYKLLPDDLFE